MHRPLEPDHRRTLRRRLELLSSEHRLLDDQIVALEAETYIDQLGLRRLKKRKLQLRDEIERVKSLLIPDLNA